jgi:protocatechuate 3,4-dioxygenase alpha subunit
MAPRPPWLAETPSQTAGPYVHIGLMPNRLGIGGVYPSDLGAAPVREGARGERIEITGVIRDGAGAIVRDALIEVWQADAQGLYQGETRGAPDPGVTGWARLAADLDTGEWRLSTVKPGRVPAPDGRPMAPHLALWIVARGINTALVTRLCFEDEAEANAACPVLARVDPPARVETLLARRTAPGAYRFEIRLQGEGETVFFDL